jgi:hypothetical protein
MAQAFESKLKVKGCNLAVWYPTIWNAFRGVVCFPSLSGLDWESPTEMDRRRRGKKTAKHAQENKTMNRSECSWEFDAWRDVFSGIRDDPLLSM